MSNQDISPSKGADGVVISAPIQSGDSLSFFGALKKKYKTAKRKAKEEMAQKIRENPKEDDKEFDESVRNVLEMETTMMKLHDHFEKHLKSMQDTILFQQMISQDLNYFYGARGSYYSKASEEYKLKSTELLKDCTEKVFKDWLASILMPLKTHLQAIPSIKDLIAVRHSSKLEVELYKNKVQTLKKEAGLNESQPVTAGMTSSNPSIDIKRLLKKQTKLDGLLREYHSMNSKLVVSLQMYFNSKDILLNNVTHRYFMDLQEFYTKNLMQHTTEIKNFIKNLENTSIVHKSNGGSLQYRHYAAPSISASYSTSVSSIGDRNNSISQSSNTKMLPMSPYDDVEECEANPLAMLNHLQQQNQSQIQDMQVQQLQSGSTNPAQSPSSSATARSRTNTEDPSALFFGFSELRAEAKERNATRRQRASIIKNDKASAEKFHQEALVAAAQVAASSIPSLPYSSPPVVSAASTTIKLYNYPPFHWASNDSFSNVHQRFHPLNSINVPQPRHVETSAFALRQLNQATNSDRLPLVALAGAADAASATSNAAPHNRKPSHLDTQSHLLASTKAAIPIVNTSHVLEQMRSGNVSAPHTRSNTIDASTAKPKLSPLSPTSVTSSTVAALSSVRSPTSSTSTVSSTSVGGDIDADDYVPPPPSIPTGDFDWDSSSDEESSDEEEEEDEDAPPPPALPVATSSTAVSQAPSSTASVTKPYQYASTTVTTTTTPSRDSISEPTRAASGSLWGKPILTGKFAALTEKFGGAGGTTPTASTASVNNASSPSTVTASTVTPPSAASTASNTSKSTFQPPRPFGVGSAGGSNVAKLASNFSASEPASRSTSNVDIAPRTSFAQDGALALIDEDDVRLNQTKPVTAAAVSPAPKATSASELEFHASLALLQADVTARLPPSSTPTSSSTSTNAFASDSQAAKNQNAMDKLQQLSNMLLAKAGDLEAAAAVTNIMPTVATASAAAPITTPQPTSLETVIALYDYPAQRDVEVSFSAGDEINVLSKDGSGWWTGRIVKAGEVKTGLFPSNFTRPK